jgi:hypothetical protein
MNQMKLNPDTILPPSETCVFCGMRLEDVGGNRLIAQQLRGIILSDHSPAGGGRDYPRRSFMLVDEPEIYMVIWGERAEWTDEAISKAKSDYLEGKRPWFCQICGHRQCTSCGSPIQFPMGSDTLKDDGRSGHTPILPFDPGCINHECEKHLDMDTV